MTVTCTPSKLHGTLGILPSKSDAHRKFICAALSENHTSAEFYLGADAECCEDILATVRCLEALGAAFSPDGNRTEISPICREKSHEYAKFDCGESGSTFRFMLPIAAALCERTDFTGAGRLPERPISVLADQMAAHGVMFSSQKLPFSTSGRLRGGMFELPGNVSSQFLTGLMLALPLVAEDSEIRVTTPLQSEPYLDLTIHVLKQFGIEIITDRKDGLPRYRIRGNQIFSAPASISIDGDWSNAAFWLTANALGSEINLTNLQPDSPQGDKQISSILRDFENAPSVMEIDMRQIPDLLPILAVRAAFANHETQFVHAERLRLKESDRLETTAELIRGLGGRVTEHPDGLTIHGGGLVGGTVHAHNDHRLAMAAAIAATGCRESVRIIGAEAVKKSYPRFFECYQQLGGICDGLDLR